MRVQTSNDTLVVTGASRGIGAAIAELAGARGYAVAVNFAAGEAEARAIAEKIESAGGRARAIHADISREEDIIQLFETAERATWARLKLWSTMPRLLADSRESSPSPRRLWRK